MVTRKEQQHAFGARPAWVQIMVLPLISYAFGQIILPPKSWFRFSVRWQ